MKAFLLLSTILSATTMQAATIVFDTSQSQIIDGSDNQGRFSLRQATGEFTRGNYFTGAVEGWEYRSFFSFDLSTLNESVTAAVLQLPTLGDAWSHDNLNQELTIYDVNTRAEQLVELGSQPNTFADIGNGNIYGSVIFSTTDPPSILTVALNSQAVSEINAARGGFFSVGAAMTSIADIERHEAGIFGSSSSEGLQALVVTINSVPIDTAGDYNGNGRVDAADYTVWRDTLGQITSPGSGADGNSSGEIDHVDFEIWHSNFRNADTDSIRSSTEVVPEPAMWAYAAVLWTLLMQMRLIGSIGTQVGYRISPVS